MAYPECLGSGAGWCAGSRRDVGAGRNWFAWDWFDRSRGSRRIANDAARFDSLREERPLRIRETCWAIGLALRSGDGVRSDGKILYGS